MNELSLIVKATVVVAIGLGAATLARRTRASIRHVILASTFIGLLLLPLTTSLVPEVAIEVPIASAQSPVTTASNQRPRAPASVAAPATSVADAPAVAAGWMPAWPSSSAASGGRGRLRC